MTKRHLFDQAAVDGGYDVLVTGHNLDDEAAVLFGNVLHWHTEYLGRQAPVLPARAGFPKKVKPLVRLGEREMAAYCIVRGIDYIVDECPNSVGAKSLLYKDALNLLEQAAPGTKQSLYWGFLERGRALVGAQDSAALRDCLHCGQPTTAEVCAFCRMTERAAERMRVRRAAAARAAAAPETAPLGAPSTGG